MWGKVQYLLSEFSILKVHGKKELWNIFEADNELVWLSGGVLKRVILLFFFFFKGSETLFEIVNINM